MLTKELREYLAKLQESIEFDSNDCVAVDSTNNNANELHKMGYITPVGNVYDGYIKVKLTTIGINELQQPLPGINEFEIDEDVPLAPIKKKGGRSKDIYPFDKMKVGDSFHVSKSAEMVDPAKTMNSTVGSANKRYKGIMRFAVRTVGEEDPKGSGVRIHRKE